MVHRTKNAVERKRRRVETSKLVDNYIETSSTPLHRHCSLSIPPTPRQKRPSTTSTAAVLDANSNDSQRHSFCSIDFNFELQHPRDVDYNFCNRQLSTRPRTCAATPSSMTSTAAELDATSNVSQRHNSSSIVVKIELHHLWDVDKHLLNRQSPSLSPSGSSRASFTTSTAAELNANKNINKTSIS